MNAELAAEIDRLKADIAYREYEKWFHLDSVTLYSQALRKMARRVTSFRSSYYQTARDSTRYIIERNEARARVEQLTAALTELVEVAWEAIPFVGFEGYLPERTEQLRYRVNAARAALSADA